MTVLPIRLVGDPVLRQPATPVETFDAELRRLVKDLQQTLGDSGGAGLAAPQIGVGLRVFALHPKLSDGDLDHLVNPQITFPDEDEQDGPEGCLSIPGVYLDTKRRMNVVATGFNLHGDPVQIVGSGMLSRCIQHETDHLDGVLFLDRQDAERQQRIIETLRAASWFDQVDGREPVVKVSPH
ncbi:peptide deformylase [Micromonospora sp. ALFpr18c]|uniref:peptide deformylase n=1 Tax=unclassified Micromonospora TaxID=2617518 RepID=UPI00124AF6D5|nr:MULTISPECIES: peptide deformylase [unclassified Micromonospora]KAB1937453.1 peptide deformylase [Micromonospora sp. ALFpr18c]MDG4758351.1 peptide deformylase [Micromonospora sp. WMMD710]